MVERLAVCSMLTPTWQLAQVAELCALFCSKWKLPFSVYIKHSSITQQLDNSQTHQLTNSSACQPINSPSPHLANSSTYKLVSLPAHQLDISPTHKLINLQARQLASLSTRHFPISQAHQLASSLTHKPTNSPPPHLTIPSTCQLIN